MDRRVLWVWLTLKFTPGKSHIKELLEHFGTVDKIYAADDFRGLKHLTREEAAKLKDKSLTAALEVCRTSKRQGIRILVYDDPRFPDMLRNIDNPVYVLYFKGTLPDWNNIFMISVVGTRHPSKYGIHVTRMLSSELAAAGVVIVTGLARGLDSEAAWSAFNNNMFTIGVVGGGVDVVYPPENGKLFEAVTRKGIILSEYPPGTTPYGHHFPVRNRIIAGLAKGVLITEASSRRSGTLITANEALNNNRDVFAVPGDILRNGTEATNRLIQQGAKCVLCADDIIKEYPYALNYLHPPGIEVFAEKRFDNNVSNTTDNISADSISEEEPEEQSGLLPEQETEIPEDLSEGEKCIAELLKHGERHIDELIRESGIESGKVSTALIMLEMQGIAEAVPGNKYRLKRR